MDKAVDKVKRDEKVAAIAEKEAQAKAKKSVIKEEAAAKKAEAEDAEAASTSASTPVSTSTSTSVHVKTGSSLHQAASDKPKSPSDNAKFFGKEDRLLHRNDYASVNPKKISDKAHKTAADELT